MLLNFLCATESHTNGNRPSSFRIITTADGILSENGIVDEKGYFHLAQELYLFSPSETRLGKNRNTCDYLNLQNFIVSRKGSSNVYENN